MHMTNDPSKMSKVMPYKGNDAIYIRNGECLKISCVGETKLKSDYGNLELKNVLVVPNIKKNLLLVEQLNSDNSCLIEFSPNHITLLSRISANKF